MVEPEEHAEEEGVEEDSDDNRSGEVEELATQLVLVRPPEIYMSGSS